tara:strand:- start:560 stop:886 length:327 start_codon:yes stop_codon:yes gene_type:complete
MNSVLEKPEGIPNEVYTKLLPEFLKEVDEGVLQIRQLFDMGKIDELKKVSHKIKGASASYGAKELEMICSFIEKTVEQIDHNLINSLNEVFERTRLEANKLINRVGLN